MNDYIDRAQAMNAVADTTNILKNMDYVNDGEINRVKRAVGRILEGLPTINTDAVPVSELKDTEKERDYWMNMAHSYEQTILRLTISASDTTAEPVRHGKWKWLSCTYDRAPREKEYECSECHHKTIVHGDELPWEKYCPNCGRRMNEE